MKLDKKTIKKIRKEIKKKNEKNKVVRPNTGPR